jgi:PPOX class probable F420-dependent enzyme
MDSRQAAANLDSYRYLCLDTFRKNGSRVSTPVWFVADQSKLYVMTRSDSGKMKRIRNNPNVEVAPCTVKGKPLGEFSPAFARIAPHPEHARTGLRQKYFLARIPFLWSRKNIYVEITLLESA